jgi:hypothetical protein
LNELQPIDQKYLLNDKKVSLQEDHNDAEVLPVDEQPELLHDPAFTIPINRIIYDPITPRTSGRVTKAINKLNL